MGSVQSRHSLILTIETKNVKKETYDDLIAVGFESQQAAVLSAHMPDVDTKLDQIESRIDVKLDQLESRIIRWMVGIFLTFLSAFALLLTAANFLIG